MSKVDYSKAKLMQLSSNQLLSDTPLDFDKVLSAGANGYILIPNRGDDHLENVTHEPYVAGSTPTMTTKFEHSVGDTFLLIQYLCKAYKGNAEDLKIWIGTPAITTETVVHFNSNNITLASRLEYLYEYVTTLLNKIDSMKPKFSRSIVQGIYYNQESIYNSSFDYNEIVQNNDEVLLMNNFSYKVHNELNLDLIWMPYLPTRDVQNSTEGELFHRIGSIIAGTTCFDCALLQPSYTTVDSQINTKIQGCIGSYSNHMPEPEEVNYSSEVINMVKASPDMKENAIANMDAICQSMKCPINDNDKRSNCLFYRAYQGKYKPTCEPKSYSHCLVGAVLEYNPRVVKNPYEKHINHIFGLCGMPQNYDESLAFKKYLDHFSRYVGSNPVAFYWEGNDVISDCMEKAAQLFNSGEYSATGNTLSDSSTNYLACIDKKTELVDLCNTIGSNFLIPKNDNAVYHNFGSVPMEKDKFPEAIKYSNDLLHATYPQMYWFSNIRYRIMESSNNLVNKVLLYTHNDEDDDMDVVIDKYSTFSSATDSIVTLLKDSALSPLDQFVKIHDWLTDNVVYTTEQTYDYNSAYGALTPTIRKANSKGFSEALTLLCQKMDIACVPVHGFKDNEVHSWNYVSLGGKWRFVDASLNIPTADDHYRYRYFLRKEPISYVEDGSLPTPVVSEETYIKFGNVDDNSETITVNDAALLQNYMTNPYSIHISPSGLIAADVDGSGHISSNDVACIQQKAINSSYILPIIEKLEEYN